MKVNSRVFTERADMFEGITIPNCPTQFKAVAQNIVMLVSKPGYSAGKYNTMTELDKIIMLGYWREYDYMTYEEDGFDNWFIHTATNPELIRRARQWLVEHNYLLLNSDVQERAMEAGNKFRHAVRSH